MNRVRMNCVHCVTTTTTSVNGTHFSHLSSAVHLSLSLLHSPLHLSRRLATLSQLTPLILPISLPLVDTFRPLILQPHQHDLFRLFTSVALTHCFLMQLLGASLAVPTVYHYSTYDTDAWYSVLFCALNRGREIASGTSVEIFSCVIKCSLKHKTRACGNMHKFASKTTHIFSPTLTHWGICWPYASSTERYFAISMMFSIVWNCI